jgi:hypothetical protein
MTFEEILDHAGRVTRFPLRLLLPRLLCTAREAGAVQKVHSRPRCGTITCAWLVTPHPSWWI